MLTTAAPDGRTEPNLVTDASQFLPPKPRKQSKKKKAEKSEQKFSRGRIYVSAVPLLAEDNSSYSTVQLSPKDRAPQMTLSPDGLTLTGNKGYRMARSTHGCSGEGAWFYELEVLNAEGHCRIGWASRRADLQMPVGADTFGFAYRDTSKCLCLAAGESACSWSQVRFDSRYHRF